MATDNDSYTLKPAAILHTIVGHSTPLPSLRRAFLRSYTHYLCGVTVLSTTLGIALGVNNKDNTIQPFKAIATERRT